jgi:hypothetical protein
LFLFFKKESAFFFEKRNKKLSRLSTNQHGLVRRLVMAHDSLSDGGGDARFDEGSDGCRV